MTKVRLDLRAPAGSAERIVTLPETAEDNAFRATSELQAARAEAIERTKMHAVGLMGADFPDLDTLEEVRVLQWIFLSVLPAARSTAMQRAASIYQYARSKIVEIRTMTLAQANAYDPASDSGWPT